MRYLWMLLLMLLTGCAAGQSTDHWLRQLKDAAVVKRRQAVRELGARTTDAARIMPALVEALRDDNAYVRRDAAVTLGKLGPGAKPTIPALRFALKDKDRGVRQAAAHALQKIANAQPPPPTGFR